MQTEPFNASDATYCCLGCELAASIVGDRNESGGLAGQTALRLGLAVFFSMNVMMFTMVLWSWDAYAISDGEHAQTFKELLRIACLLFTTPVVLILSKPLLASVIAQASRRVLTTDLLLLAGVGTAYFYSVVSIVVGHEHIYFEVACMILVAVTLGRWLEATGKLRATNSLESLQNLLPESARVVTRNSPDQAKQVPLDSVAADTIIRVLPGERIPLDGIVRSGMSYVDQRLVTGESEPVQVTDRSEVFGGSANLDGCLDIRVTAAANAGVIQRLIQSVRETATQTSRPERMADRLASIFVPSVFVIVIAVFGIRLHADGLHSALMSSMSVALIACPCALAIATPLAIWAALSKAGEQGIVFRTSDDLTTLAELDHICLDKTGTLTTGQPRLADSVFTADVDNDFAKRLTRLLASQTQHPVAGALLEHLPTTVSCPVVAMTTSRTLPGKGVFATIELTDDRQPPLTSIAVLGSAACCEENGLHIPFAIATALDEAAKASQSSVCIGWDESVRGCFVFDESLRTETNDAMAGLNSLNLPVTLLTGDQPERAARIAEQLEIGCLSRMLPEDKQTEIRRLQSSGKVVAMVGDGLNDAPALSLADVGIGLGCGVEVSRDAADVCLVASDLRLLPWAITLARRTKKTIRRNLFWAVAYNVLGIGFAATGRLNPIIAAMAMVFSSSFVIVESLRLAATTEGLSPIPISPTGDDDTKVTRMDKRVSPSRVRLHGEENNKAY